MGCGRLGASRRWESRWYSRASQTWFTCPLPLVPFHVRKCVEQSSFWITSYGYESLKIWLLKTFPFSLLILRYYLLLLSLTHILLWSERCSHLSSWSGDVAVNLAFQAWSKSATAAYAGHLQWWSVVDIHLKVGNLAFICNVGLLLCFKEKECFIRMWVQKTNFRFYSFICHSLNVRNSRIFLLPWFRHWWESKSKVWVCWSWFSEKPILRLKTHEYDRL